MSDTSLTSGRSAAVRTQATPGSARALLTSSRTIRAHACVLRKTLAWSINGSEKSPAYTVAPTALPIASTRRNGLPTCLSSGRL